MEKPVRMEQTPTRMKEGSPELFLRGENLEYYRNIEYLKEVTRQANALLDRSNAKYENILDDQKLGYRVRARSTSDTTKSKSPETEGRCGKCGLSHGATDFCIVEQIMDHEKQIEDEKRRSKVSAKWSWKSFTSISMDIKSLKTHPDSSIDEIFTEEDQHKLIQDNINILERMTSGELLDTYDTVCARYGANAARQFLLANSKANPPEVKIEKWTTPKGKPKRLPELSRKPLTHYKDITKTCLAPDPERFKPLCPGVSEDVTEKMEKLVDLIPPCEAQPLNNRGKKWREVFDKDPPKQEAESPVENEWTDIPQFISFVSDNSCCCNFQQCVCGTQKICTASKIEKKCSLNNHEIDNDNNYVLTMRKRILKRREKKRTDTLHALMLSKQSITPIGKEDKSEEFVKKAGEEQFKSLKNCLTQHLRDEVYDQDEFDKNVQKVASMSSPSTGINIRQWDHWIENMKEQQGVEEQDEVDSQPSDIQTDEESNSMISHSTRVDYKPGRIKPTRIPYADDVYDLIDNLYDKITRKFEKGIVKNSFKESRLMYRPTYAFFYRKMTVLSCKNSLFHDVMNLAKFPSYLKRLTPYKLRKLRKMKRLQLLQRKQVRTERRRVMARGLQLGKKYQKINHSYKYTPEYGYIGFKPQERKMLDPNQPNRFANFNLVKCPLGEVITKKRIHHDFKLIQSMFDAASNVRREDLMDQGMLDRKYEFQRKIYNMALPRPPLTDSDTENEGHSEFTYSIPHKEDIQLLQKANTELESGNINLQRQTSYEDVRRNKAEQSNSADKLTEKEQSSLSKARINNFGAPQKCTSSTNVKGEKNKHKEKSRHSKADRIDTDVSQNLQVRSSVKSLTNLLPPLKGQNAKKGTDNEFEATISSLQNELSNLLMQSRSRNSVVSIKTDSDEVKSISKKQSSGLTKLPELKTVSRKPSLKTARSMSKVSSESLPQIKQRESVENLKPGRLQEKLPRKGLARKMSTLNLHPGDSKPLINGKLPQLVGNEKMRSNASDKSLSKFRKKSDSKRLKNQMPTIVQHSVSNKAWR